MVSVRALMAAAAFLAPALAAGLSPEQIVTDLGALKGKAEAVKSTATGAGNNAPDAAVCFHFISLSVFVGRANRLLFNWALC